MTHPVLERCIDCGDGTLCGDKYEPCGCDCHEDMPLRDKIRTKDATGRGATLDVKKDIEYMGDEPTLNHCTVRKGDDEWHIECRFSDGQKYAAIKVDGDFPLLADRVAAFLNATSWTSERPTRPGKYWLAMHPDQRGLLLEEGVYKVEVREANHVYHYRGMTRFSNERLTEALWAECTTPDDPFAEYFKKHTDQDGRKCVVEATYKNCFGKTKRITR